MKVGIAGFAGSGKTTIFRWLTGVTPDPAAAQRGQVGIAKIPDERLDWLSAQFRPKKTTPAILEFVDTPGLLTAERRDNPRRLGILRDASGLVIVLNGFATDDLADQMRRFLDEMIFADLEIITNRLTRLGDQEKKPKPAKEREAEQLEMQLLGRIVSTLEQGRALTELGLREEEEKSIRSFQLLSLKPQVILVNTAGDTEGGTNRQQFRALHAHALYAPVKLELELEELEPGDRQAFMDDLGLQQSHRQGVLRSIYEAMGQIVFFTVGEDECRAWPLRRGQNAVEGAGQIHTDLAKRFVRAEVVSYEDFRRLGSMKEAKTQGVYRLEGKTYVVQDGDIMHIL